MLKLFLLVKRSSFGETKTFKMYGTASYHTIYGSVMAISALTAVGLYYALSGRGAQVRDDAKFILRNAIT